MAALQESIEDGSRQFGFGAQHCRNVASSAVARSEARPKMKTYGVTESAAPFHEGESKEPVLALLPPRTPVRVVIAQTKVEYVRNLLDHTTPRGA